MMKSLKEGLHVCYKGELYVIRKVYELSKMISIVRVCDDFERTITKKMFNKFGNLESYEDVK